MSRHERLSGTIRFYHQQKGYGFIRIGNHEASETFFHIADFVSDDEPHQGDRVTFVEKTGRDGRPRAISVMPAAV
jgi:cold shock CspA family protein